MFMWHGCPARVRLNSWQSPLSEGVLIAACLSFSTIDSKCLRGASFNQQTCRSSLLMLSNFCGGNDMQQRIPSNIQPRILLQKFHKPLTFSNFSIDTGSSPLCLLMVGGGKMLWTPWSKERLICSSLVQSVVWAREIIVYINLKHFKEGSTSLC